MFVSFVKRYGLTIIRLKLLFLETKKHHKIAYFNIWAFLVQLVVINKSYKHKYIFF